MIGSIRLQNFRIYKDSLFEFDQGVNIIVGPNACGKTSLIEGIMVLAQSYSYRAKDQDLIAFKKSWSRIEGDNDGHSRVIKLSNKGAFNKSITIDDKSYKRLSLTQKIPVVLFEPNDLRLFSGSPESRRDYLDTILVKTADSYKTVLSKYNRALAQRNMLLKSPRSVTKEAVFPWNVRLSQLGGQLVESRVRLIEELNLDLPSIYRKLSTSNTLVKLKYTSQIDPKGFETNLFKKLESNLKEDQIIGFTRHGPHRDDFSVLFNNHPSNVYASRGETRTAILGLKLGEMKLVKEATGINPLFLLDDVFSELDGKRRRALAKYLDKYQCFITTTDADLALKQFPKEPKVIPLAGGII